MNKEKLRHRLPIYLALALLYLITTLIFIANVLDQPKEAELPENINVGIGLIEDVYRPSKNMRPKLDENALPEPSGERLDLILVSIYTESRAEADGVPLATYRVSPYIRLREYKFFRLDVHSLTLEKQLSNGKWVDATIDMYGRNVFRYSNFGVADYKEMKLLQHDSDIYVTPTIYMQITDTDAPHRLTMQYLLGYGENTETYTLQIYLDLSEYEQ